MLSGKDRAGNESGVATLTVNNIDRSFPIVAYGTNGATNIKTASTTVTVTDVGTSNINSSTLQCVWDTQNITTPSVGWNSFVSGNTLTKTGVTGTYYLWIKVSDNAGNMTVSKTNAFSIDNTPPTVVFATNGGTNPTSVSTTVTVSDTNGLNASTLQYVWDTQNITTPSAGWIVFTNGATQTKTGDGTYYLWVKATDNAGNIVTEKSSAFMIGEVLIPVSTVKTVNTTFSGTTTGFSYNNPVIPAGFVAVDTNDAKWTDLSTDWDKGLVILDSNGNQFVWVPVDGTNVTYGNTAMDTPPSGFSVDNITTTYKGFYIARYEGGYVSGKITSKKVEPFTYITYTTARIYSDNMATSYGYDTSKVGTTLVLGGQWNAVMKWIQNSGKNITDSRTWGNYYTSLSPANVSGYRSMQVSGYSNYWKAKNIYDLAGNAAEWVNQLYSPTYYPNYYLAKGGDCSHYDVGGGGGQEGANYYFMMEASENRSYVTLRVALYIL